MRVMHALHRSKSSADDLLDSIHCDKANRDNVSDSLICGKSSAKLKQCIDS